MIGHYVNALSEQQEDRVLQEKLAQAAMFVRSDGCRCLVGVVRDMTPESWAALGYSPLYPRAGLPIKSSGRDFCWVGKRFDELCQRFGEIRVNAAIRNRILSNRARRELGGVRDSSGVAAETP